MTAEAQGGLDRSVRRADGQAPWVAVVGAGLAGLAAAWRLQEQGFEVRVFESDDTVGGRAATVRKQGYIIDTGAAVAASTYTPYLELARQVGAEDSLGVTTTGSVGIVRDGKVHIFDPTKMLRTGLTTRLLSTRSKLRLARLGIDVFRAKRRGQLEYDDSAARAEIDTESIDQYATRVLDSDISAYIGDPISRTMTICDGAKVSKVELFSGIANIMAAKQLLAVDGGQNELPQAVASKLPVQLNSPVQEVVPTADGVDVSYTSNGGQVVVERFDGCIVATTLPVAAAICPGEGSELHALNEAYGYVPGITVAIGTRVQPACPAVFVQYSARENHTIALLILEHNKRADRAPAGHGLIAWTWEADAAREMFDATDEEIIEKTMVSMRALFPEAADSVDMTCVTRWPQAVPNLGPGCYKSIAAFNSRPNQPPRIQFAGDFVGPPGQHGAVYNGNRAASNLVEALKANQLIG